VTWEYKTVSLSGHGENAEQRLNTLAEDGWELVGVVPDGGTGIYAGTEGYFKRPKQTVIE